MDEVNESVVSWGRADSSGARTPPGKGSSSGSEEEEEGGGVPLKDSLGSLARPQHAFTPPDSSGDEAETALSLGASSASFGRARSLSLGEHRRTPPGSPPDSPPASPQPPLLRNPLFSASSDSSAASQLGSSPNASAFRWGERLVIPSDSGRPDIMYQASQPPMSIRDLIEISSGGEGADSLSISGGHHLAEIGFERSEKALGQGAFGKVWLGLRDSGEFLAIKEIQIGQGQRYTQRLEAVENEIELMRNLDHPHIVRYLGSRRDEARGSFYILLEYVSCGSIQALLKTMGGPLDERVIRKYSRQILLGLQYLHSRDPPVAHRDIKAANVLVETTGNVKLADFGCSKVFSDLLEEGAIEYTSVLGTPHWMAPEVIRQEGAGLAADIWSFGCTVVEMATGQPPWSHIRDPTAVMFYVASTKEMPLIPESLSEIGREFLKLCFQRDPSKRPTAEELLLHPFVSSERIANASLKEIQDTEEDFYNSLLTQSLSTVPQFLSVLPANLVIYIFQFLDPSDLCAVSAVCRQWRVAGSADALWEVKARTRWPWVGSAKGNRWRDLYSHSCTMHAWKQGGKLTLDTLRGHGKPVLCIEAHHDRLATGGEDKKIRVWSVSRRKCVLTLKGHVKSVTAVRMLGDNLLSGGAEGSVRLWDLTGKASKPLRRVMESGGSSVAGVDMMNMSGVSASHEGIVRFWDLETGKSVLQVDCNSPISSIRMDSPTRVFWSCADGSLRVCDVRTKGETGTLLGHSGPVTALQLGRTRGRGSSLFQGSPFNWSDLLCSVSIDGRVKLWDTRQLKAYSTLSTGVADDSLYSVDFDGAIIATAGKSRTLHIFDLASEEPLRSLKQHHSDVIHGVSLEDGRVFTSSRDKTCKILSATRKSVDPSPSPSKPRSTPSFLRLTEMFQSSSISSMSSEEK